jgi:hypothetical protein
MNELTADQADELLAIASALLRAMDAQAEEFCERHDKAGDPRLVTMVQLMLIEMVLEGLMIVNFDEASRVPLVRQISHNVQATLRLRRKQRPVKFDA